MIITSVLGNLADLPAAERERLHLERVSLTSADLMRRVQRVTTDHGRELGLRLSGDSDLRDKDILLREGGNAVVVDVALTTVIVIAPRTGLEMGRVAHTLGNRHLPAQFFDAFDAPGLAFPAGAMVVQDDRTVQAYLDHQGTPYAVVDQVMEVPFRHASHSH